MPPANESGRRIRKLLVANRGEISIRVMRAAAEMGIGTVSIYAHEDRFALHRFKADESYRVGAGSKPIAAYLDIKDILRIAREAGVDAIHPGYGFLSENPQFAEACAAAGITFIGPSPSVLRTLGDKVAARKAAEAAQVPVLPASKALPYDLDECKRIVAGVGYPVMMKASWGGGGRGMRVALQRLALRRRRGFQRRGLVEVGNVAEDGQVAAHHHRAGAHLQVQAHRRHGDAAHRAQQDRRAGRVEAGVHRLGGALLGVGQAGGGSQAVIDARLLVAGQGHRHRHRQRLADGDVQLGIAVDRQRVGRHGKRGGEDENGFETHAGS